MLRRLNNMYRPPRWTAVLCLAVCIAFAEAASDRPKGNFRACHEVSARCPVKATLYGYRPNLAGNAFLLAVFGICFIACLAIGIFTKTWTYTIALGIGTFLEAAGYVGRVLMHDNPWSDSGFKLQICALVLGPSFVAAAIYLTLKHFVLYCGPQYSLIQPRLYPWIFVGCDFGSIVLQAIGGGMASAGGTTNKKLIDSGNNLIVAGIAFQVIVMVVCGLFVLVYVWRYRKGAAARATMGEKSAHQLDKEQGSIPMWKVKIFGWMVVLAYVTVLIRCIYRVPEMASGWGNKLMRAENEFLILDGMMVAIACIALTVFHPAFFFPPFAAFRQRK